MKRAMIVLGCVLFSGVASAANPLGDAVRIHRSSSVDLLESADAPEVRGHTYVTSLSGMVDTDKVCQKIVNELHQLFIEDMPQAESVWDYVIACVPGGKQSFLSFQILIEPSNESHISTVEAYIEKHQDQTWNKLPFHFEHINAFTIEKLVECFHLPDTNNWQKWDFKASLRGGSLIGFSTYRLYRRHQEEERLAFRSEKVEDLYSFLSAMFGAPTAEKFKSESLRKANVVTARNPMTLELATGRKIESTWADGHFRECFKFDGGFCAK
jgi:hypothetical protein